MPCANGNVKVGEFGRGDTSIQVTGLRPGQFYSIRVIASNAANFSTLGPLIQLRTLVSYTKPRAALTPDGEDTAMDSERHEAAVIRVSPAHFEPVTAQSMVREHSGSNTQPKRPLSGPRTSQATSSAESTQIHLTRNGEAAPEEVSIDHLTERLDSLRLEQQELERQILEEEVDSKNSLADLTRERDHLKQILREREEASSELRKQGNLISKQQKSAQSRKAQKERLLNSKKAERQKTKEEISRWNQEIIVMRQNVKDMSREQSEIMATKDDIISDVRSAILEDQAAIKSLEEEIRATGSQIKAMEKDRERMSDGGEEETMLAAQEKEGDQAWETHAQSLQLQLNTLWQTLKQVGDVLGPENVHELVLMMPKANADGQRAKEELGWWTNWHARDPSQFAAISALEYTSSMRSSHSRRNRQGNSRTSTVSSPPGNYAVGSGPFHNMSTMSPSFSSVSPFFSMGNGMTVPPPTDQASVSQTDAEALTGAALMSPTADDLLPSNLFRDDDTMSRRNTAAVARESLGSLGSDFFSRQTDYTSQAPRTPVSAGSRNGSRLSSPHDSLCNLPGLSTSGDLNLDPDRRSINSTSASFHSPIAADANPLGTNRFASLFSNTFNRQRGKSGNDEPPQLGTLRQGQSQSFPRNYEDEEFESDGTRRRRGSHGHWASAMGLLNRSSPGDNNLIRTRTGSGRRSRLNMFGYNNNPLQPSVFADQSSSARPSSINSFDQILARPSSESQRNPWAIPETTQNRSSPLGTYWATSGPWSRGPSRRPSVQHGSTSNLSIGSTPLEPEYQTGSTKQPSEQLPIGTRPRGGSGQSPQRPVTPKLNPTAPSFKTLFGRGEAKKAARAEKAAEKTKDTSAEVQETDPLYEESSPQNPRLSRDAQSIVTSASLSESYDSLERSTSGTPSEAVTPSGPKESLMQRISRKGSSSKFNVPWSKERGGLFSRKGGDSIHSGAPSGELDEDGHSEKHDEHHTNGAQPTEKSSRSSLSWPNIRRKSKKNGMQVNEGERGHQDGEDDDE